MKNIVIFIWCGKKKLLPIDITAHFLPVTTAPGWYALQIIFTEVAFSHMFWNFGKNKPKHFLGRTVWTVINRYLVRHHFIQYKVNSKEKAEKVKMKQLWS